MCVRELENRYQTSCEKVTSVTKLGNTGLDIEFFQSKITSLGSVSDLNAFFSIVRSLVAILIVALTFPLGWLGLGEDVNQHAW